MGVLAALFGPHPGPSRPIPFDPVSEVLVSLLDDRSAQAEGRNFDHHDLRRARATRERGEPVKAQPAKGLTHHSLRRMALESWTNCGCSFSRLK